MKNVLFTILALLTLNPCAHASTILTYLCTGELADRVNGNDQHLNQIVIFDDHIHQEQLGGRVNGTTIRLIRYEEKNQLRLMIEENRDGNTVLLHNEWIDVTDPYFSSVFGGVSFGTSLRCVKQSELAP